MFSGGSWHTGIDLPHSQPPHEECRGEWTSLPLLHFIWFLFPAYFEEITLGLKLVCRLLYMMAIPLTWFDTRQPRFLQQYLWCLATTSVSPPNFDQFKLNSNSFLLLLVRHLLLLAWHLLLKTISGPPSSSFSSFVAVLRVQLQFLCYY